MGTLTAGTDTIVTIPTIMGRIILSAHTTGGSGMGIRVVTRTVSIPAGGGKVSSDFLKGRGGPPGLSSRDFFEDTSPTLLLLRVSPAAKRAKEEKGAGGTPPRPPGKGCAPCNPA